MVTRIKGRRDKEWLSFSEDPDKKEAQEELGEVLSITRLIGQKTPVLLCFITSQKFLVPNSKFSIPWQLLPMGSI